MVIGTIRTFEIAVKLVKCCCEKDLGSKLRKPCVGKAWTEQVLERAEILKTRLALLMAGAVMEVNCIHYAILVESRRLEKLPSGNFGDSLFIVLYSNNFEVGEARRDKLIAMRKSTMQDSRSFVRVL
jgi:hypothetical protein